MSGPCAQEKLISIAQPIKKDGIVALFELDAGRKKFEPKASSSPQCGGK
jgi:hypothetical protein